MTRNRTDDKFPGKQLRKKENVSILKEKERRENESLEAF